jgi:class 3 adenylate cyclase
MKRLTYISKCSDTISDEEIENIGTVSVKNNQKLDLNGVLLYAHGMFFQVLEGEKDKVDQVYEKIKKDPRHTDIVCLKAENNISERVFSEWSMKTVNLEKNVDILIKPLQMLLDTIIESYGVLEKYTQPSIFKMINEGINPLLIPPQAVEKIVLFSDIQAFSTFVEKMPIAEVVELVNSYLTICTSIITAHGGEVSKFIGDCVMSYFAADKSDAAIAAAVEILTALEALRDAASDDSLYKVLYTGIGMSQGVVIQCNMGATLKKDYTILGDAVNVASRLESLTREYPYHFIFSENVKNNLKQSWNIVELGSCFPKGKEEPVNIYSLDDTIVKKPQPNASISYHIHDYLDALKITRNAKS